MLLRLAKNNLAGLSKYGFFSLVWKYQNFLKLTKLLSIVWVVFASDHRDRWQSIRATRDSSIDLRRYVRAEFLQYCGVDRHWNEEVQGIWRSRDSFAQEFFFSLLEVTIVCWLLSREIPLQGSYLEQPCKGQFHCSEGCKRLVSTKVNGHFIIWLVIGKELAGRG